HWRTRKPRSPLPGSNISNELRYIQSASVFRIPDTVGISADRQQNRPCSIFRTDLSFLLTPIQVGRTIRPFTEATINRSSTQALALCKIPLEHYACIFRVLSRPGTHLLCGSCV